MNEKVKKSGIVHRIGQKCASLKAAKFEKIWESFITEITENLDVENFLTGPNFTTLL